MSVILVTLGRVLLVNFARASVINIYIYKKKIKNKKLRCLHARKMLKTFAGIISLKI